MSRAPIAIDARMWTRSGIGRYLRELVSAMERLRGANAFRLIGSARPDFIRSRSKIYSLAEQLEVPRLARGAELLHVPNFNIPAIWGGKLVATVHDLTYLHEAGAAGRPMASLFFRAYLSLLARKADAVITVSEFTKQDLLSHVRGLRAERVFVTPEAASDLFVRIRDARTLESARRELGLSDPFILSVGSLRPHKNLIRLINAVERLRSAHQLPLMLVLAGQPMPGYAELESRLARAPFVRVLPNCADAQLVHLYNLTEAFVMPSLREGFGLPLVEAMRCGAPILASNRSSIPEVLGDAGVLFDPERVDALSDAIYNVLKNRDLRENLSQKGLKRSEHFSWENTARLTLDIYERVLSGRV